MRTANFGRMQKFTLSVLVGSVMVTGCAMNPIAAPQSEDVQMVKGPPVRDIVTPFDEALSCLRGRVHSQLAFSVGAIVDQTGKEQLTEGGTGKFVTQGAGDIVQSALYRTGVVVLNRRDPRILETELKWGVRDKRSIVPSNYFITGSINSLDFIPGGGIDLQIGGIGPQYRQHRILVGLDLSMTDARTGRVVANVPLQKQIFSSEFNFSIGRFMKDELVLLDIGGRKREALNFALRQMLNLGTFELLTQAMPASQFVECRGYIDRMNGFVDNTSTAKSTAAYTSQANDGKTSPTAIQTGAVVPTEPRPQSKQTSSSVSNESSSSGSSNGTEGNGQSEASSMSDETRRIILTN